MKIAIIDDYQDAVRTLSCFPRLAGHEVTAFKEAETDAGRVVEIGRAHV